MNSARLKGEVLSCGCYDGGETGPGSDVVVAGVAYGAVDDHRSRM